MKRGVWKVESDVLGGVETELEMVVLGGRIWEKRKVLACSRAGS